MDCELYNTVVAACVNLKFYRGDKTTFIIAFWTDAAKTVPFDLSGFTGTLKMQVRLHPNDPRVVVTLEEGTGLTIGTVNTNELTIETQGVNSNLPALDYSYDVEGVDTGDRLTFLLGDLIIVQDITR